MAAHAAPWQWTVKCFGLHSLETDADVEAHLWIPDSCRTVSAVMFAMQNMTEEAFFESSRFLARMGRLGVAIVWFTPPFGWEWDERQELDAPFDRAIAALASASGHSELPVCPLIPFGHSAQATMPWNFAAWHPDRTLCLISFHGDAPRTNLCGYGRANVEWGRDRNIDGIPALMVMGEYEWWDARLWPALAFRMMYPASCVSFLGDAGRGHFDASDRTIDYVALFIEKAMRERLRGGSPVKLDPQRGWLAEMWSPAQTVRRYKPAPAADYKGCRHEAFWYFDREMADMAEARYRETMDKQPRYISLTQDGKLLPYNPKGHCKLSAPFKPDADGRTFHLKAVLTDSTKTRILPTPPGLRLRVKYVCGPCEVINDTTFRVRRDHKAWGNRRREGVVYLVAEAPADARYKECVQEIEIKTRL